MSTTREAKREEQADMPQQACLRRMACPSRNRLRMVSTAHALIVPRTRGSFLLDLRPIV